MTLRELAAKVPRWVWWTLLVLVLLVLAFGAGRLAAPVRVEYREKLVETMVENTETKARAELLATEVAQLTQQLETRTHTVKTPVLLRCPGIDGGAPIVATREETTTESTSSSTAERAAATKASSAEETVKTVTVERVVEKEKLVTVRPDWRAHVLPGVRFGAGDAPRLVIGAQLERRIVGPLSAGLWGAAEIPVMPTVKAPAGGSVGASLSFEW